MSRKARMYREDLRAHFIVAAIGIGLIGYSCSRVVGHIGLSDREGAEKMLRDDFGMEVTGYAGKTSYCRTLFRDAFHVKGRKEKFAVCQSMFGGYKGVSIIK